MSVQFFTSNADWSSEQTLSEKAGTFFSASRYEEEMWRVSRLKEAYEVAQQICMLVHHRPFPFDVIVAMHDHKGHLDIMFADDDWEADLLPIVKLAWVSHFESSDDIDSITLDRVNEWPWDHADAVKTAVDKARGKAA